MEVKFRTQLHVVKDNGSWRLIVPFVVKVGGETFVVPPDFETDFASVPRVPLAYWFAGNTAHKAAVLHDYLYSIGYDKTRADDIFLAVMEAEGVSWWRRRLMYRAVKWFGQRAYDKHTEARNAAE
jgi:hypothetical protein